MTGCLPGLSQVILEAHEPLPRLNFRAATSGVEECLIRLKPDQFYRVLDDEVVCLVPGVDVYELIPCVTCYRTFFLWPVPVIAELADASDSDLAAREVLSQATEKFVQVTRVGGSLQVTPPKSRITYQEPPIPNVDLEAAVEYVFADRTIRSIDDPIAKKLMKSGRSKQLRAQRAASSWRQEATGP